MAKILVIDDHDGVRHFLREALVCEGHQVETAPDGETGLKRFQAKPVDLVIADIFMPGLSGMELIHRLRKYDQHVRIIAISGGAPDLTPAGDYLPLAEYFGANMLLQKPVSVLELETAVRRLLGASAPPEYVPEAAFA